jgi:hypothetical protein
MHKNTNPLHFHQVIGFDTFRPCVAGECALPPSGLDLAPVAVPHPLAAPSGSSSSRDAETVDGPFSTDRRHRGTTDPCILAPHPGICGDTDAEGPLSEIAEPSADAKGDVPASAPEEMIWVSPAEMGLACAACGNRDAPGVPGYKQERHDKHSRGWSRCGARKGEASWALQGRVGSADETVPRQDVVNAECGAGWGRVGGPLASIEWSRARKLLK